MNGTASGLSSLMEKSAPCFCDIHAHVIYGMDDGPKTAEEMYAMLDKSAADGVGVLYATPHRMPGMQPFDEALYGQRLAEAQAYCARQGYAMAMLPGAEILYSPLLERHAEERLLPTLSGSDKLLLEFLPNASYATVLQAVGLMNRCGYRPVLAHIERYACLYHGNALRLKESADVSYQVNCRTVLEGRGFFKTREIKSWFSKGLIDFVASDCHDTVHRPTCMRAAYNALSARWGQAYAEQLMCVHPSPI